MPRITSSFGLKGDTGAAGPSGSAGATGAQGPAGSSGATGPQGPIGNTGAQGAVGPAGAAGSAGATLIGTVNVTETAAIAINAGVRKVTVTVSGVTTGNNYLLFPISATPAGYALADVVCTAANTLQVSLTAPLLALGASYSIPCRLVRINT